MRRLREQTAQPIGAARRCGTPSCPLFCTLRGTKAARCKGGAIWGTTAPLAYSSATCARHRVPPFFQTANPSPLVLLAWIPATCGTPADRRPSTPLAVPSATCATSTCVRHSGACRRLPPCGARLRPRPWRNLRGAAGRTLRTPLARHLAPRRAGRSDAPGTPSLAARCKGAALGSAVFPNGSTNRQANELWAHRTRRAPRRLRPSPTCGDWCRFRAAGHRLGAYPTCGPPAGGGVRDGTRCATPAHLRDGGLRTKARQRNRVSCTFFEVRCTRAPLFRPLRAAPRPHRIMTRGLIDALTCAFAMRPPRRAPSAPRGTLFVATNLKKCARTRLSPTRLQRTSKNVQPGGPRRSPRPVRGARPGAPARPPVARGLAGARRS